MSYHSLAKNKIFFDPRAQIHAIALYIHASHIAFAFEVFQDD